MKNKHISSPVLIAVIIAFWILGVSTASVRSQQKLTASRQQMANTSLEPLNLSDQHREDLLDMAETWIKEHTAKLGISRFRTVNRAIVFAPVSQERCYSFKILLDNDEVKEILMDSRGDLIDVEDMTAELSDLYLASGKMDAELANLVLTVDAEEKLPVILWCLTPENLPFLPRPNPELAADSPKATSAPSLSGRITSSVHESELHENESLDLAGNLVVKAKQVSEVLNDWGIESVVQDGAPIVVASLTASEIQAVAKMENVLQIYHDGEHLPHMEVARRSTRAHIVNNRGYTGKGVKVGVVEVGGAVNLNHPYLNFDYYLPYSSVSDHAAAVAGVIASQHNQHRGIAPNAELFIGGSSSGRTSELINVLHVSRDWGARVINNSWGMLRTNRRPEATARACDQLAIWWNRTIVISAGNDGRNSGYVGSPGTFYNGITVGATDDRRTESGWDDQMASYSSFVNPYSPYNDRLKPDVVAPGGNQYAGFSYGLKSLAANQQAQAGYSPAGPWLVNTQGTSFSSPAVAAGAALMMDRAPGLKFWPESVKAILTATAMQNIEGSSWRSDKDGAGSVMLDRADHAAARFGRTGWGGVVFGLGRPTTTDLRKVYLEAGKRTRIAIAWNQNPNYTLYDSRPCADLDLQILAPNGTVQAGSYTWDSTLELVDFKPPTTGLYTIRVRKHRMDMSPGYLGFAWYQLP